MKTRAELIKGVDVLTVLGKLPERCFSVLASDPTLVIGIHRGVPGYTPLKNHATAEQAEAQAKRLNDQEPGGVTAAQREAMEVGSCFGWHVPGANPDNWTGGEGA